MLLKGSCHCRAVRFTLRSAHPVPYQRCYCSICRKQQGGGGYTINIAGAADTLKIQGEESISRYNARIRAPGKRARTSTAERAFCKQCGSALWLFSPEWPELIHPFASAIDSELPAPKSTTHIMLEFKPGWVTLDRRKGDILCDGYPDESIAEWHDRHGMTERL
jgi:hypothetical protein